MSDRVVIGKFDDIFTLFILLTGEGNSVSYDSLVRG